MGESSSILNRCGRVKIKKGNVSYDDKHNGPVTGDLCSS
jgi:hypothetical protein